MRDTGEQWPWPAFILLLTVQIWLAHALAFFPHEYAHSIVAWLLGWKASPFDLHFPPRTAVFWLIQLGVDQNVDEAPIYAAGQGWAVALIAAAGMVIGNALITLPLSRLAYRWARRHGRRGWASLAYWVTVASIGNLWAYVPIRTFTSGSDMGSVQHGFGWSPWTIIALFGIPTAIILIWFVSRTMPASLRWLFPGSLAQRLAAAILTMIALFGFYGMAGLLRGGPISFRLSIVSTTILLPVTALLELLFARRRCGEEPA